MHCQRIPAASVRRVLSAAVTGLQCRAVDLKRCVRQKSHSWPPASGVRIQAPRAVDPGHCVFLIHMFSSGSDHRTCTLACSRLHARAIPCYACPCLLPFDSCLLNNCLPHRPYSNISNRRQTEQTTRGGATNRHGGFPPRRRSVQTSVQIAMASRFVYTLKVLRVAAPSSSSTNAECPRVLAAISC